MTIAVVVVVGLLGVGLAASQLARLRAWLNKPPPEPGPGDPPE